MEVSRRRFLSGATATGSMFATGLSRFGVANASGPAEWTLDAPLLTLKDAARASGLLVGCAVNGSQLNASFDYGQLVRAQSNIVVAENAFKFAPLRPTPTSFHFREADAIADYAHTNGIKLRGHNFIWHRQLPDWFDSYTTKRNAQTVMEDHISTVEAHFGGGIHSWDVVNEAIELADGRPDALRNSPWLKLMGPGYIDTAFKAARRADPKALLFYNEYGVEGEDDASAKKREAVLTMLRGMLERDVPVDGLGIQSHLMAGHPYGPGVRGFIRRAHGMGLRVMLTEMDVNDREIPSAPAVRDIAVADTYSKYLRAVLADGYVTGVLTWGITDRATWLNQEGGRTDGASERPLPFDAQLNPKPAFVAQRRALSQAPRVIPVLRPRTEVLLSSSAGVATGR